MTALPTPDGPPSAQLDAEIAQLRAQFPRTADLYREVCVLLFFRYGITPTANKLYQLVKKGSMSAPADALAAFWATLRDKSRVRIESPDLPDEIKGALSELAIAIWDRAQASAQEALTGFRSDASQEADRARAAQATAETEVARLRQELTASAALLDSARAKDAEIEQQVAALTAACEAFKSQLQRTQREQAELQRALEAARRDFAAELDKQRAAGELAEERLRASETRALLEIDRERVAASRAQKALDDLVRKSEQGDERYRKQEAALQAQVGDLRHQVGILEGNLSAGRAESRALSVQLARAQDQLTRAATRRVEHASADRSPRGTTATKETRRQDGPPKKSSKRQVGPK
ncbi:ATPase [Caballeronia choica]|jgi:chromosome segregation ATPase|uniref:ATPase n=1 Tax=Caballeronia choica TaxID=326476 RepID=A0A158L1F9_9BURK|nr:DNA-binding protein [Caballeronia choica]SAL87216.1 ATPase [Caballeronia choica]